MDTRGNLGGIFGIPIVELLSGQHSWRTVFVIGPGSIVAGAMALLGIDVEAVRRSDRSS
jgi:hypothetical protein